MKNLLRRLWSRIQHDDLREEIESHIQLRSDLHQAEGMSREDAEAEALRRFGNVTRIHEDVRAVYVSQFLEGTVQDIQYTARTLSKSPVFTLVAVLTLALAIGANAAIFQLLDAVVLKPLPVSEPYRLFQLQGYHNSNPNGFSYPLLVEMAKRQTTVEGIFAAGGIAVDEMRIGGRLLSEPAPVRLATGNYFEMLGPPPQLGRFFTKADDDPSLTPVAVISDHFWKQEFGGQPGALGQSLQFNGASAVIVGVARREFSGERVGDTVDVWIPMTFAGTFGAKGSLMRSSIWLMPLARLRPDVPVEKSQAELNLLWSQLREYSIQFRGVTDYRLELLPAHHGLGTLRGQFSEALWLLMGIVALVMLIACCNVATLLLGRARARRHEIGVRLSMGADRSRVVRQLLTESFVLVIVAAGLGLGFAVLASRQLVTMALADDKWRLWTGVDWRVIGFTLLVSVAATLIFSLAPALTATRVAVNTALQENSPTLGAARSRRIVTRTFVVAQVALSLTLIAGAGLLVRSFWNLTHQDLGFNPAGVVMAQVGVAHEGNLRVLIDSATHQALYKRAGEIPGIRAAAVGPELFGWIAWAPGASVALPDRVIPKEAGMRILPVSPNYVETLDIRVLRGRSITETDDKSSPKVAILNQTAARRMFGTADPIGRRFADSDEFRPESQVEVVGVIGDFRVDSARGPFEPVILMPLLQRPVGGPPNIVLRVSGTSAGLTQQLRAAILDVAPSLRADPVKTLDGLVSTSVRREHLLAWLSAGFAVLALILAAVGLYGIVSYSAQLRAQEISIRLAVGGTSRQITFQVLSEAALLLGTGMLVGTLVTLALSRSLRAMLFGLQPNDPATLVFVGALLLAVGLGAAYIPAYRATRLDPLVGLRRQ